MNCWRILWRIVVCGICIRVPVCVVCATLCCIIHVIIISWRQSQIGWWSHWTLTSTGFSARSIAVWKQVGVYSSGWTALCYHWLKPTGFALKQRLYMLSALLHRSVYRLRLYQTSAQSQANPESGHCFGNLARANLLVVVDASSGGSSYGRSGRPPPHWPKFRAGLGSATQTRGQIFT